MKKKKAIRDYVLISLFIVITFLLTFIIFPVPGTNQIFKGFGNLHLGLELGGGVKNTYTMEVADWYKGNNDDVYNDAFERVQNLLDKYYADAKVYFTDDDKLTVEVPDTNISDSLLINFFEIKKDKTAEAETVLDGRDIKEAYYTSVGTSYGVYVGFTEDGTEKFEKLTKEVSSKPEGDSQGQQSSGKIYLIWNKDYENATELSISQEINYIFLQGEGISTKESGELYAHKLESSKIGVNMKTELDPIEISPRLEFIEISPKFDNLCYIMIKVVTIVFVIISIVLLGVLFKELGLVSMLSLLFALMFSTIVSAMFDLQTTFYGWLGFFVGYILNYALHLYYLNVIKNEYAKGKKFTISFTSAYKKSLFNILDILLITTGSVLLMLIVPSSAIKMFVYNFLMTIPATAFTSMLLNKIVCVDYTAFNIKDEKRVNFKREENVDEIK